jgi:hypothetical protein
LVHFDFGRALIGSPELYEKFLIDRDLEDEYEDCLTPYENMKLKFEKDVFKVKYTAEFCIETDNGSLMRLNRHNLKTAYEELYYMKMVFNEQTKREELVKEYFMENWFKDSYKRMYNSIDFLPTPLECPRTVYNSWKGFEIERANYIDREPENCDKILQLIKVLCNNNDDAYEYVLDWFAQMLQSPAVKPGTAVVLKSKQGAGKGTLVEIMRKIMGNAYVEEEEDPRVGGQWRIATLSHRGKCSPAAGTMYLCARAFLCPSPDPGLIRINTLILSRT